MSLSGRSYLILPKDSPLQDGSLGALGIGVVPAIYPPKDVPVKLVGIDLRDRWLLKSSENNTYHVFAGRGYPNDYKWIVKDKVLYATATHPPHNFRFETAGNNLYKIGIFAENLVLTLDKKADHQLTFKPADGSDAQLFQVVPIEKD